MSAFSPFFASFFAFLHKEEVWVDAILSLPHWALKNLSAPLVGDKMAGIPPAGLTGRPQYVRLTMGSAASAHPNLDTAIGQGEGPGPPLDYPDRVLYRPFTRQWNTFSVFSERQKAFVAQFTSLADCHQQSGVSFMCPHSVEKFHRRHHFTVLDCSTQNFTRIQSKL